MEDVLSKMSEQKNPTIPRVSRKNDGFSRSDVVNAFNSAFDVIGGINRLALWANANPDKFYPLYAKLLPATTQIIGDSGALEIIHRIAPTALDRHDPVDVEDAKEISCPQLSSDTSQDDISDPSTNETSDGASSSPTDEPERQLQRSTT